MEAPNIFIFMDAVRISVAVFTIFVVSRFFKFYNSLKRTHSLPGRRPPFQPFGLPGALLPTTSWNLGPDMHWINRKSMYSQHAQVVSIVPWLIGPSSIWSNNLDVARQVTAGGHKSDWIKPEEASQALLVWGMNLVASEGQVWRRHRRVVGPAFNSKLYKFVWEEAVKTYKDMIVTEGWAHNNNNNIPCAQDLTFKYALLLIGKCGFGFNFTWADPPQSSSSAPGSQSRMPVQEAIRIVADSNLLFALAPKWCRNLPLESIRHASRAHDELDAFMHEQVAQRRAVYQGQHSHGSTDTADTPNDIFSLLIAANEAEAESKYRLSEEELIGNVFVMLFAGHETTAHTLAAALGFLAVYEEIQEEVYEEVKDVLPGDSNSDPEYEECYSKLIKTAACFFEAVRMSAAGHVLVRQSTCDTVLNIPVSGSGSGSRESTESGSGSNEMKPIPIPKGVNVVIDMVGVQYNPRYFPDPYTYKPSRWYEMGNNDSEAFSGFSIGPRACVGRRFAITEAVCFIACLLRDYRVEPLLGVKSDGTKETRTEWRERVLDGKIVLTLGVKDVPLRFVPRV
ncbi:hypothetical protein D9758_006676 [Tetrapyrgos nigripes]|uniref:Cytochrome P450 n=1 Tax=Tetrapyrgos nigripes TaxID=182062 RepID=A0A8H5GJQ1_9AGAR|nr:hypothetical protein D9758_006676 [Tetrapyrgos nigripes]